MDNLKDFLNIKRIVYYEDDIKKQVIKLANQITVDYKDSEVVIIGVIKGSLYFFTDLTRQIDLPIMVDFIGFGNIPDKTKSTGVVKITKDIDIDIKGKHVILVEDVIRTGLTTCYLISKLEEKEPLDINVCTLLNNPERLLLPVPIKYCGFEIGDEWLVGYGMDAKQIGRNLPYIAEINKG